MEVFPYEERVPSLVPVEGHAPHSVFREGGGKAVVFSPGDGEGTGKGAGVGEGEETGAREGSSSSFSSQGRGRVVAEGSSLRWGALGESAPRRNGDLSASAVRETPEYRTAVELELWK